MEEIWKDIEGYEGLYQVSNLGRVKSLPKGNHKDAIIMKQSVSRAYYSVNLHKNKKSKTYLVHRLVAEAFIPNLLGLPQVGHKDENNLKTGDGCNNCADNLYWTTDKENCNEPLHCQRLSESKKGEKCAWYGRHHTDESKEKIRKVNIGRHQTDEAKRKISLANKGRKSPWEGRHHTEKTREKMRDNHADFKGKKNPRCKSVTCVETNIEYWGAKDVEEKTGISRFSVTSCCTGNLKTAGGYHWRYTSKVEDKK